ncbi:MAG: hypothetical protein K1X88_33035 [Nannocystaceae bacterium]|nr:hypothetical protein [Nannocystaceae bacterium]
MRTSTIRGTVLVAALALALASCGREKEAAPVTAARNFAALMQRGDAKALIPLLSSDAVEQLERAAARASDQVGGRRSIELHEMLQIVDVPDTFQVAKAELVAGGETDAQVAIIAADGTRHMLDLVLQDGTWRVRVPLPTLGVNDDAT